MSDPRESHGLSVLPQTDLLAAVRAFLLDCQARRLSPRTIKRYGEELHYLRTWLESHGVQQVIAITATHLRAYLVYLQESGRNPGGQHIAFRVMRTFLRWYQREYEPDGWRNPMSRVQPPKVAQDPLPPVSIEHVRRMLATCNGHSFVEDRDRAAILALLDTGCRSAEFRALNIGDVDLATGAVHICHGKGGKARTTFLGAKSRKALLAYLRHRRAATADTPLWVSVHGERLSHWGLRRIVARRAAGAGIACPPLHAFRRAFAINSLRAGVDLVSLQRLLGHADLSVIHRYLRQTQDDLQAAHRKGSPVDNLL